MDLTFENTNRAQNSGQGIPGTELCRPDWYGLRARLFAVHDAHRLLVARSARVDVFAGCSFDPGSATLLATYSAGLCPVNPTGLGNRKPDRAMDADVAGVDRTGDRG